MASKPASALAGYPESAAELRRQQMVIKGAWNLASFSDI